MNYGLSVGRVFTAILISLLILVFTVNTITLCMSYHNVRPYGLKLRDYAEFIVKLKIIVRANKTTSDPFEINIYANNWWSKLELINSTPKPEIVYYDYNRGVEVSESDPFSHTVLVFDFGYMSMYEEREVELTFLVRAYKVSGSILAQERRFVGRVSDAERELGEKYSVFTGETTWWDYSHPNVQRVIREIRKGLPLNATVYDIVERILYWISTNMYYYEPEDYPIFRLKASEILNPNRTITTPEGKRKFFGVCRHFVDVFVALARGLGVPANRFEGLVIAEAYGRYWLLGYHAWAEVYMPGYGWIPVEVTLASRLEYDIIKPGDLIYYYIPNFHEYTGITYQSPPYDYLYWIDSIDIVKVDRTSETQKTTPTIATPTVTVEYPVQTNTTTPTVSNISNNTFPANSTTTHPAAPKATTIPDYKDILLISLTTILVVYVIYRIVRGGRR